jgi:AcrR family transcriptional regulator
MTKAPKKTTKRTRKAPDDAAETTALREKLVEAAMELAAEKDWRDITLAEIAHHAGVSLADARAVIACRGDVLRILRRRIDAELLASLEKEPPQGEPIDRLFDIIMRRLELLAPYRAAVRRLLTQPVSVLAECPLLAPGALLSQRWMLAAAELERPGVEGCMKTLGLELVWLKTLRAWVEDDDPGLAKTMATLDGALRRGERWLKRLAGPMEVAEAGRAFCRSLACAAARILGGDRREKPAEEPVTAEEPAAEKG